MSQVRILAFQFLLHLKIVDKVFQKKHRNPLTWSIADMVNLFVFYYTWQTCNYVLHEKMQKTTLCILNYNCTKIIYISSNIALVIARNHERIICKKVLESRAKSGIPFISTYDLLWFLYPFNRVDFFLNAVRWHQRTPSVMSVIIKMLKPCWNNNFWNTNFWRR